LTGIGLLAALAAGFACLWTPDLDRIELESRYARSPSQFVELTGLRMHVRSSGPAMTQSGPAREPIRTVVLLHGFGSSLHTWEDWIPVLSKDFRVIQYDLPGHGLTGPDASGDYTDARGIAVLLDLLHHLGIQKFSLIGHSIGGRLAWNFAAAHPERIEKLVLVAPDGFASPGFEYGKPPEIGLSLQAMRYVLPKTLLRMSLEPAYANASVITEQRLTRYHELMLAPGVRPALIARLEQSTLRDPNPTLANIKVPTLLLWGDQDAMIPVANAVDYLRALPNARLVRMNGVGHLPQEEAPAESALTVHQFLQ
jgi:pimeloyl-ACP methyl ester carboxylesterase